MTAVYKGIKGMNMKDLTNFMDTCRRLLKNPKSKDFTRQMAREKLTIATGEMNRRTTKTTDPGKRSLAHEDAS